VILGASLSFGVPGYNFYVAGDSNVVIGAVEMAYAL
jgi:hypothetical protein